MLQELDIIAVSVSLGLFFFYHLYSYLNTYVVRRSASSSIQLKKNMSNAFLWLRKHKVKDDAPTVTLAIQTLRNTILVAIFLGGGSFTTAYQLLNSLDGSSYEDNTPSFVRNIIVSTMLFASFLCWASVIRACSHLGYLVGTVEFKEKESLINGGLGGANDSSVEAGDYSEVDVDIPLEMRRLISAMLISFHLGFRFMFISIAFQFYVGGAIALLIATAIMLGFFFALDFSFVLPRSC